MKPLINLDEVKLESYERGPFQSRSGSFSKSLGAKKLGYSLDIVPPGKRVCPFHNHRVNEEMFFILEGTGTLRFGDKEYPLRKNDVVCCPPGGREVAHQILNTGTTDLKYLSLSTLEPHEICEYPDSDKIGVFVGSESGPMVLRQLFRAGDNVDYFVGELESGDESSRE